jgi:hypothetical protein
MTICAWCDEIIERPALAAPAAAVSHGICRECLSDELTRLRPTVSPSAPIWATAHAAG